MDFTAFTTADDEPTYLKESVGITPEALTEEFIRVPSDLAYWGERYAEAVGVALRAYYGRKAAYAESLLRIKGIAKINAEKLTEADAAARAEIDPVYHQACLDEVEAEAQKVACKARFDAVVAKKDMIVSIGATQRAEMAPHHIRKDNY